MTDRSWSMRLRRGAPATARTRVWRSSLKWLTVAALVLTPTVVGGLGGATPVFAQATRTWVSGVGDDFNPCSRTAPCKTWAGAISKTAAGGEIDALDPGGFGGVTITKAITLDGTTGAGFGSILASGINGVIINATGPNDVVTLRHLSINGAGTGLNGVKILAAKTVIVEESEAFGFRNNAQGNGNGISDGRQVAGVNLVVLSSSFTDNLVSGIGVVSANSQRINATIENSLVSGNGSGISIAFGAVVTVRNTVMANNSGLGIAIQSNGTDVTLIDSVIANNATGLFLATGSPTVRVNNVTISGNTSNGVQVLAGTVLTAGNNRVTGNGGNNTLGGSAIPAQ